jgi:D-alanyl-lipoteichoic acid acyltransferase DltB (MBOAT superfamily)
MRGHAPVVELLLEAGADPNKGNQNFVRGQGFTCICLKMIVLVMFINVSYIVFKAKTMPPIETPQKGGHLRCPYE